jgi:signal transduction histidine kinase
MSTPATTTQDNLILLVDDEQDIRDVLQLALTDAGHDVLLAENGRQALDLFLEKRPPIVITDIKMPVMDGIQLLRRIKREAPDTEVVMITGHGDMDLAIRSLKHEATDFITKPIHVDALEIALKRVGEKILMRRKLQEYTTNLERLLKEKSELQDHLSSLGLMIGSISHGIKGLLTGLDGGMYLLEGGLTRHDDAKIEEGWETVKVMVERVRKMVMDILFYAKKRDLQWEQVDVTRFAQEVARMVAAKVAKLPIDMTCDIEATMGACKIDPGYVHAALMNIFENAIDACLRRDDRPRHDLRFRVWSQGDRIKFEVSDTGIGMDEETLSKLFTVFFSSKGRKGTGLGLFIANKIVEQHGGRIDVSSKPGQGSCFTITIPR